MAVMKVVVVAMMALLATPALVRAEEPHADVAYAHGKAIDLFVLGTVTFGNDTTAKLGDTGGIIRTLAEFPGGPQIGILYQSGIYVDLTGSKLLNFQGTIVLNEGFEFPAGKIFFVGDGTGIQASNFLPKSIVGGTGPYEHAKGKINRNSPGPYYITIFSW